MGAYSFHVENVQICVVMVGLPARGKSLIAQKIVRYLTWLSVKAKCFNVGNYRRIETAHPTADFFDVNNSEGERLRKVAAEAATADMFRWFDEEKGVVAILDATNTTKARRDWVLNLCRKRNIEPLFVESWCDDEDLILQNIIDVKTTSPDYVGQDPEQAALDFRNRIRNYEKVYETISERDLTYVKLINVGSQVIINRIQSYLESRIVYYLMNLHIKPRCIWLSRHGESVFNVEGKIGGDSDLSPRGREYARQLPGLTKSSVGDQPLTVWTSTLKRTQQTAKYLPYRQLTWKALDELDGGQCDGLTYEEIEERYPEDFAARDADKYEYRYPGGESYRDVVIRLEPIIMELERQENIMIVTHQAVLRCIYAYFMNVPQDQSPWMEVPLHTLIKLEPKAYGTEVTRIKADIPAVSTYREKGQSALKKSSHRPPVSESQKGPVAKSISKFLTEHASAWQVHVLTMTGLYVLKNLDKILNLQSPEPLADIYSPSFFRATWILTALDAGFWTAMPIRPKPIRDIASLCFSIYYLIFADQADEKVRKVRATVTAEHLRISWEKATSTYLRLGRLFTTPRIQVLKGFEIARPPGSPYHSRIKAFLYYDGPRGSFKQHDKILLSFPGGGFVSMTPRHHDDSLCSWAKRLKIPIVSINYGKAPEYPYPYGLDECYDAYLEIIRTRGRCIGLSGHSDLQIVLIGDSAGGNLVAGTILKLLTNAAHPPLPLSVILIYPALDLNFTSWMSDEQVRLLRQESVHELHSPGLMKRKESMYPGMSGRYRIEHEARDIDEFQLPNSIDHDMSTTNAHLAGSSNLHNKSYNDLTGRPALEPQSSEKSTSSSEIGTSLAMTSRVSYFGDKIIAPEMLRAMVILYIGPHNRPDFTSDYLLSPVNAPTELLAKFPKVYMLCGEVDPLVDDTVIFAGRLREAKQSARMRYQALAMSRPDEEADSVEVLIIRGISHGFLQFPMFLPEGKAGIARCAGWIQESFTNYDNHHQKPSEKPVLKRTVTTGAGKKSAGGIKKVGGGGGGMTSKVLRALLTRSGLGWVITPPEERQSTMFDEYDDDLYYGSDDGEGEEEDDERGVDGGDESEKTTSSSLSAEGYFDEGLIEFGTGRAAVKKDGEAVNSGNSNSEEDEKIRERGNDRKRKVARRTKWEKSRQIHEGELMDRRRTNLVRSLAARTAENSSTTGSGSEAENAGGHEK